MAPVQIASQRSHRGTKLIPFICIVIALVGACSGTTTTNNSSASPKGGTIDQSIFEREGSAGTPRTVPKGLKMARVAVDLGDYDYGIRIYRALLIGLPADEESSISPFIMSSMSYAYEKRGSTRDNVAHAYMWMSLAAVLMATVPHFRSRTEFYLEKKIKLSALLSPEQLATADSWAKACWRSRFQDCG